MGSTIGLVYAGLLQFLPSAVAALLAVGFGITLTDGSHTGGRGEKPNFVAVGKIKDCQPEIPRVSKLAKYRTRDLGLLLLAEMAALATLGSREGFTAMIAAHFAGQSAAVSIMTFARSRSRESGASDSSDEISRVASALGILVVGAVVVVSTGRVGLLLAAFVIPPSILTWVWSRRSGRRIGADSLTTITQLLRTGVLIGAFALNAGVCACSW